MVICGRQKEGVDIEKDKGAKIYATQEEKPPVY